MSEFSMGFTLDGKSYTIRGRQTSGPVLDTLVAGPCEHNTYHVDWRFRIVDETNQMVAIYRTSVDASSPRMRAVAKMLDTLAANQLRWNEVIPIDDPRLQ